MSLFQPTIKLRPPPQAPQPSEQPAKDNGAPGARPIAPLPLSPERASPGAPSPKPPEPAVVKEAAYDEEFDEDVLRLTSKMHQAVLDELGGQTVRPDQRDELRQVIQNRVMPVALADEKPLTPKRKAQVVDELLNEILAYGPIQPLLDDPSISEVMVNRDMEIFVERAGKLTRSKRRFINDEHVMNIVDRIVRRLGRQVNARSPYVDARLPDGSRVNIIIPPLAVKGPCLTIRKFSKKALTADDLVQFGSMTEEMKLFLDAAVKSRLNIIISGGTGSGKTTLLNLCSGFIPKDERIVTIEDAVELQLHHENLVTLEARPPNIEGEGEVSIRDLVRNALRMRPDRIVVGECRGGETLDMLQAMNTGHDGSLSTVHSNSPRDTISRLETMALMSGMELPIRVISKQIASAVQLIVHQARLSDGSRRVVNITEVQGMEGETILLQDIFEFKQLGVDENGKVIGYHTSTGFRPKCVAQMETAGCKLPKGLFQLTPRTP